MTVSRSIFNDGKRLFENGGSLYRDKIKSVKTLFFNTNDTVLRGKCFAGAILQHPGQVALNDLARIITGNSRKDHIPTATLADKAGLPTLNEIVVKRSAVEAWKAMHGGALTGSIELVSSTTRASTNSLVQSRTNSRPDLNMRNCWNASEELRNADTLPAAKRAAKKLASESRHF